MTEENLQHTHLDGIADYTAALDRLCSLARHDLYLYERNFEGLGFNSEVRYQTLRHFLLANPLNRLYILANDTQYLATFCARIAILMRQFDSRMAIHRIPSNRPQGSEPFSVADSTHYVRRFHFDDPRGMLAINDPTAAGSLQSRFHEMWSVSVPALSVTTLGL
ncbi:MAG: hypothetical protein PHH47_11820 [Gallionella sp.]|nr:hypothetical protein [Gallionella sp.]MDD4946418.1 hypothetical protein [Gallionella sp.]MDD5611685.1 hypothetical protein [Gallionella sp.]